MISMIDIMFFLSAFLMLFASFEGVVSGIPVDLPRAATGQEVPASELIVTITRDGAFYLGDRLTSVDGLKQTVRQAVAQNAQVVAVIRADREALWEWVVLAIDAMTEAGGSSLSFTVEKPSRL